MRSFARRHCGRPLCCARRGPGQGLPVHTPLPSMAATDIKLFGKWTFDDVEVGI